MEENTENTEKSAKKESEAKKPEKKPSQTVEIVAIIIGLIVFVLCLSLMHKAFKSEDEKKAFYNESGCTEETEDRVDVYATVSSVDPMKGEAKVVFIVNPQGKYSSAMTITRPWTFEWTPIVI